MKFAAAWIGVVGSLFSWLAYSPSAIAQIVPDATLPTSSSVIPGCTTCLINGGTEQGVNLYHSFREFSIPTGGAAWFNNSAHIQNILARVTGNGLSTIDGLMQANGTANLFFLNPNGIVFGANARLQVGGSFLASTASSFQFPDGSEFSAIHPQAPPLLAVNLTPGLQYGATPATLTNHGTLAAGQDLTLAASHLTLQGQLYAGRNLTLQAQDTLQIRDSSAVPFVARAGQDLLLQGNSAIDIFTLNHPLSGFWAGGNLVLKSSTPVLGDAHFHAGGFFKVEQLDGRAGGLKSSNDPIILASGDVELGDYEGASLHILAGGRVTLGNVTITEPGDITTTINSSNNTLFNGSRSYADLSTFDLIDFQPIFNSDGSINHFVSVAWPIAIDGSTQATLDVRAGVDWSQLGGLPSSPILLGETTPITQPVSGADITITGNIRVSQPDGLVLLTNQFLPNRSLMGGVQIREIDTSSEDGSGGTVIIDSRDRINVSRPLNPEAVSITTRGSVDGGNVALLANGTIRIEGSINTTADTGQAGNVLIRSQSASSLPAIQLVDAGIDAAGFGEQSRSGNITLEAINRGPIHLIGSSGGSSRPVIYSDTFATDPQVQGEKTGGDIQIWGGDITLQNYELRANINSDGLGNGGNIFINGHTISLADSYLTTNTDGVGNAGNLSIVGQSIVSRSINEITTIRSNTSSSGNAGEIFLQATESGIDILGTAFLFANTVGEGNGGNVFLRADKGNIRLNDVSLFATTDMSGSAGSISLFAQNGDILLENNTNVTSSTFGLGAAGAILIDAPNGSILLENNTSVSSTTAGVGDAGAVFIEANVFNVTQSASVSTDTAGIGQAGNIIVNVKDRTTLTGQGSGLFAKTTFDSAGSGGNIIIDSGLLLIEDGAAIAVDSDGSGTGGNILIEAARLELRDRSSITAETASTQGGNIFLDIDGLLILRRNSLISATAGIAQAAGDGGNITIQAAFIIAVLSENSDITANAFTGKGGDISITTNAIYGLKFQPQATPFSDITASSEFGLGGTVDISTLNVDPNSGLIDLPANFVETTNQIQASCAPNAKVARKENRFIVTGRGGIPESPEEAFSGDRPLVSLMELTKTQSIESTFRTPINSQTPQPIIEAQGWRTDRNGSTYLVLESQVPISPSNWQTSGVCSEAASRTNLTQEVND